MTDDRTVRLIEKRFDCMSAELYGRETVKAGPLVFRIKRYTVSGVGNLSVMSGSGMMGLMEMEAVILTPLEKDAPLFSYDRISAMGNDTLIAELYDTVLSRSYEEYAANAERFVKLKESVAALPAHDLGEHWYDGLKLNGSIALKGKKKLYGERFDGVYEAYLGRYLEWLAAAPNCDADKKAEKTEAYVEGLIQNGGASTDAFIKAMGREKTEELFKKVLFGTHTER